MILKILTHLTALPPRTNLYANLHLIMPPHNMVIPIMFSREREKEKEKLSVGSIKEARALPRPSAERAREKPGFANLEPRRKPIWRGREGSLRPHYCAAMLRGKRQRTAASSWRMELQRPAGPGSGDAGCAQQGTRGRQVSACTRVLPRSPVFLQVLAFAIKISNAKVTTSES